MKEVTAEELCQMMYGTVYREVYPGDYFSHRIGADPTWYVRLDVAPCEEGQSHGWLYKPLLPASEHDWLFGDDATGRDGLYDDSRRFLVLDWNDLSKVVEMLGGSIP